jgi:hypothetical protein
MLCQSHHDIYAGIPSRATASGGDGMDFRTLVHAVRRVWAPAATFHHAKQLRSPLSKAPGLIMLIHG